MLKVLIKAMVISSTKIYLYFICTCQPPSSRAMSLLINITIKTDKSSYHSYTICEC